MPRTPTSKVDDDDDDKDRNRKRQRHSVARLPVDESESNSSSSTNLQADFLSEAAVPFSDTTNKPKAATPSKRRKTLGNRVTPSTNKLPRDEVGSTPLPMESSSSSASSKTSGTQPKLPAGVINIYTPLQTFADDNHNSILSLTNAFIKTYGVDYYSQLKEGEIGTSTDVTSPLRSNTSSPVSHADSVSTPNHRVVYLASRPTLGQDGSSSSASTGECMPTQPHLTPKMRAILIDWLIELSEEYKLSESTIFCAVALVNKSLECGLQEDLSQESLTQSPTSISTTSDGRLIIGRDMLQCLGCACMWMACKMEEIEPPSVEDFVYISDNSYTKEQITTMEMTVCSSLHFRLCHTTIYMFMDEYLRASTKVTDLTRHLCLYLLELSLLPLELTTVKPSLVCAAAIYLCRITLGLTDATQAAVGSLHGVWTKTLEHYTGYSVFDLEDVVKVLHTYHMSAEESSLKSVYAKYKVEKYSYVALKTVPNELGF